MGFSAHVGQRPYLSFTNFKFDHDHDYDYNYDHDHDHDHYTSHVPGGADICHNERQWAKQPKNSEDSKDLQSDATSTAATAKRRLTERIIPKAYRENFPPHTHGDEFKETPGNPLEEKEKSTDGKKITRYDNRSFLLIRVDHSPQQFKQARRSHKAHPPTTWFLGARPFSSRMTNCTRRTTHPSTF